MTPADGMAPDALRELVREVLRDVLPALADGAAAPLAGPARLAMPPAPLPGSAHLAVPPAPPSAPPSGIPAASSAAPPAPPATRATGAAGAMGAAFRHGAGPQPVRLASDEDLHAFVLRVIALADNPKRRRDLLTGRLRFTLAPAGPAAGGPPGVAPATQARAAAASTTAGHAPAASTTAGHAPATPAGDHRIEKGAVTERAVQAAASAGARLVLGPRAVLTPLARDRARALGVPIEKER